MDSFDHLDDWLDSIDKKEDAGDTIRLMFFTFVDANAAVHGFVSVDFCMRRLQVSLFKGTHLTYTIIFIEVIELKI